jgi:Family of unknown function (DUF5677)
MDPSKFTPLPSEYSDVITALKKLTERGDRLCSDFDKRLYNRDREKALLFCYRRALDLAKGCLEISSKELPESLITLTRALIEALIWARFITLSEENAHNFINSPLNEMKRTMKKNLAAGYAHIFDRNSNEDKTKVIMESEEIKKIPHRLTIEKAARDSGLIRLYTMLYGFMSMSAHGITYGIDIRKDVKTDLYASLCTAVGALECIEAITNEWITNRKHLSDEILSHLLGIKI